ncbi:MAG TPA: hypothetical protein VLJ76_10980 [Gaiellaceae bacterium]|nr:hypothetical protein [Gaiellaceae bacterium]
MSAANAPAKINLALVVGPLRPDGKHEVSTVLQRVGLADSISLERRPGIRVDGFEADTLVADALAALAAEASVEPDWHVTIEKRIPVAAGLGGGSADAATALSLANATLDRPLLPERISALAATIGADVPFFLASGSQLGTGTGTELEPLTLPLDYTVLLLLPDGAEKHSTGAVYAAFDDREGAEGFEERREALTAALASVRESRDLAALPPNDLGSSPLAANLTALGAFRADVSGAGPVLYGLFETEADARAAADDAGRLGRVWITAPTWYG